MKIQGNEIRPGMVIEHKGALWQAVKIQHTQPGKGGAYLQVELKGLPGGSKLNERFRSSESVERVRLDRREYQYLYADDDMLNLMDTDSYEQIQIDKALVGEGIAFLQDGMELSIESYQGRTIGVGLPETVTLAIAETEPRVKGQTAASSYKPAMLENGVRIMVPPFVGVGDRIIINTADGTYARRAED